MRRSDKTSIEISKHINTFLNGYAPSCADRSAHTLKSYNTAISLYVDFLDKVKCIVPEKLNYECFCRSNIEEWLKWLAEKRKCSPQTCNVRLASLRAFLKYLGEQDVSLLFYGESASTINRRKEPNRKICGLSKNAVRALLNAPDTRTTVGRRDIAMLVTLYGTAARIDELLSLKIGQLQLDVRKPYVNVIGKNGKIRTLFLLPKAVAHLKQHIREQHGANPDFNSYVFYSRVSGKNSMMTQMAVSKRLKLYAGIVHPECPEVPLTLHAHQFRHAKASHWLEDGMNIIQISLLLGHEQLETTMVYLDITLAQKADALSTLEEENAAGIPKKWYGKGTTLAGFCGVRPIAT